MSTKVGIRREGCQYKLRLQARVVRIRKEIWQETYDYKRQVSTKVRIRRERCQEK
jgi:hypothetical protein